MIDLDVIEKVNVVLGVLLNLLLLYLIRRFSRKDMGNYKYLLTVFAAYDIFLSVIHGILNPRIVIVESTMGAVLHTKWQSHHLTAVFYAFFTIPFALMNIHFLYRYWNIKNPVRLLWFSKKSHIMIIAMYPISQWIIWVIFASSIGTGISIEALTSMQNCYKQRYNDTIEDGWLILDFWSDSGLNVWPSIILLIAYCIIVPSMTVAVSLASLTYHYIIRAQTISLMNRSAQLKILVATFVPVICVYFPYTVGIGCPFFGFPDFGIPLVFHVLVSLFPGWDAIVIMTMMKDYREGLISLIVPHNKKISAVTTQWRTNTTTRASTRAIM